MKIFKICFSLYILVITLFLSACGADRNLPLSFALDFFISDESLEINILDTGESDSIFIEIADYTIVIDSGSDESESTLLDFIIYHEMNKIDYLIMTHSTENYLDRVNTILSYADIGTIFHPDFVQDTPDEEEFIIRINDLTLTIYPTLKESNDDLNSYSLITSLQYSNHLLLFAGDATTDYLNEFLLKNESQYTILMLPQHTIYSENLEELLYSINPTHSILTSKSGISPDREFLQILATHGIQKFLTCDGKITIKISGNTLNITQQLNKFTLI